MFVVLEWNQLLSFLPLLALSLPEVVSKVVSMVVDRVVDRVVNMEQEIVPLYQAQQPVVQESLEQAALTPLT